MPINHDIRLNTEFFENPKVMALEAGSGPRAVLDLIRLWVYASKYRPDGLLTRLDVRNATHGGTTASALVCHGFLDKIAPGRYKIHDWAHYNYYAATRQERSERARESARRRWGARPKPPTPDPPNKAT